METKALPATIIEPGRGGLPGAIAEAWRRREILCFLAWRDLKVRYKQTVLGVAWALLQPLASMAVLTLVFHKVGGINAPGASGSPAADSARYMVFAYAGLLPWLLFQSALVQSSASVVGAAHILTKVYFPRILVPLASVVSGLVDFAIALLVLAAMLPWAGARPGWGLLLLPVFVGLAVLSALAAGIWFAALNAKYRDFRYVVPFMAQVWMFLSPVAYASKDLLDRLPPALQPFQWLYHLNPMVGVVEGFRWSLLGQTEVAPGGVLASAAVAAALFVGGLFYFRRMERVFADLV